MRESLVRLESARGHTFRWLAEGLERRAGYRGPQKLILRLILNSSGPFYRAILACQSMNFRFQSFFTPPVLFCSTLQLAAE